MLTKLELFQLSIVANEHTGQFLSELFMTPKPLLREIVFSTEYSSSGIGVVFDALADVVSTLEVVRFLYMNVTAGDINRLVEANPGLTNVEVAFDDNSFRLRSRGRTRVELQRRRIGRR